jgi:hypothetical protein
MSEVSSYSFSYKEVVEALIKFQGVHEGIWQLAPELSMNASNIGPNTNSLRPTIVISIAHIGIVKATQETNMAVDAAKVNPMKTE